ncbi:hypothetical protein Tco_0398067 [Tanacetum coccineum]
MMLLEHQDVILSLVVLLGGKTEQGNRVHGMHIRFAPIGWCQIAEEDTAYLLHELTETRRSMTRAVSPGAIIRFSQSIDRTKRLTLSLLVIDALLTNKATSDREQHSDTSISVYLSRNKINDGRNVLGTFMNAPIFVGNFSVVTYFTVVENIDAYRDERMGEVIVGEPFCKASYVEARRFDGMITIFNGNDSFTYQMVRSHPRFKHLTNKQCNKIPPILKVSKQDRMNGISHSYQKLKGFYKGILDLGPEFIQDEKIVERLTLGHISVHEME